MAAGNREQCVTLSGLSGRAEGILAGYGWGSVDKKGEGRVRTPASYLIRYIRFFRVEEHALLASSSLRIRHQGLDGVDRPREVGAALVTDQLL